jgi:hypothetical protein
MALVNIVIADKLTGDTLTAGEFNQVKNGLQAAIARVNEFEGDVSYFGDQLVNVKVIAESVESNLDNKVEKVPGKGLSTADFTTVEKEKLAHLEVGGGGPVLNTQMMGGALPTFNYATSVNGELVLTTIATILTFMNVPNGGSGRIAIRQDATGGWGIDFVAHEGLGVQFLAGMNLQSNNINAEPNGHTLLLYERLGAVLYISTGLFAAQAEPV